MHVDGKGYGKRRYVLKFLEGQSDFLQVLFFLSYSIVFACFFSRSTTSRFRASVGLRVPMQSRVIHRDHPRRQLSPFFQRSVPTNTPLPWPQWALSTIHTDSWSGPVSFVYGFLCSDDLKTHSNCALAARTHVSCVPRRTFTSTATCRAQDDDKQPRKRGIFSSVKDWVLGGSKQKPWTAHTPTVPKREEGGLGASSIFADDAARPSGPKPSRKKKAAEKDVGDGPAPLEERHKDRLQVALNPNPKAQLRWEKKMVIREIRKRGRVPKPVQIQRTERESLSKSHWFKTSVKKLGPLARQIAGKNIDEAILQMRFSKKKAAEDVLGHLEHAKNVAMVRAGMGLGSSDPVKPITVTLKTGERKKINDPTAIYIQQAWVNRGPYGFDMDHRARGQINRLRPPATGLSVLLKEEKTRVREWEDREADALRKRKSQLWTQLPDRKISAQNQYYSW